MNGTRMVVAVVNYSLEMLDHESMDKKIRARTFPPPSRWTLNSCANNCR